MLLIIIFSILIIHNHLIINCIYQTSIHVTFILLYTLSIFHYQHYYIHSIILHISIINNLCSYHSIYLTILYSIQSHILYLFTSIHFISYHYLYPTLLLYLYLIFKHSYSLFHNFIIPYFYRVFLVFLFESYNSDIFILSLVIIHIFVSKVS